ncbi:Flp family type IVb pilin [Vibrio breoganii]
MNKFKTAVSNFINDEEGLTILEYVIGAALIVAAIIGSGFWEAIETKLNEVASAVSTA